MIVIVVAVLFVVVVAAKRLTSVEESYNFSVYNSVRK